MSDFRTWLERYLEWRKKAAALTDKEIDADPTLLWREAQVLEPLYSQAETFKAEAECFLAEAQEAKTIKKARIVWAVSDTAGRCRVISSRAMKVAQQIKIQDASAPGRR